MRSCACGESSNPLPRRPTRWVFGGHAMYSWPTVGRTVLMPRVDVVADVQGNAEALARAGEGADALLVLGDLVDFVDYHDHSQGILGTLFGADNVAVFARLRREGARQEMAAFAKTLWDSLADPASAVDEAVRKQYAALFAGMAAPTYVIPGNVDVPRLMPEFSSAGIHLADGHVVTIGGWRFGFVGGSLLPPGGARSEDHTSELQSRFEL